ncbi:MAG: VTT domain-containing protein [Nocardioidaceae bacterium]|nr:VTT domain-containing protein [Nocardioidaceae bacterium]
MNKAWLRVLLALLWVGAGVAIVWIGLPEAGSLTDGDPGTVLAFAAVYVVAVLIPVPKAVFTIAAGAAFGPLMGGAVALTAASIGAAVAYLIARYLARDAVRGAVRGVVGDRAVEVEDLLHRRGFLAVLVLRVVPFVPFTALNYVAGLTSIRVGPYLAGTVVGMAPGTAVYASVGHYGREPGSWPFLVSIGALAVVSLGGALVLWQRRAVGAANAGARPADP